VPITPSRKEQYDIVLKSTKLYKSVSPIKKNAFLRAYQEVLTNLDKSHKEAVLTSTQVNQTIKKAMIMTLFAKFDVVFNNDAAFSVYKLNPNPNQKLTLRSCKKSEKEKLAKKLTHYLENGILPEVDAIKNDIEEVLWNDFDSTFEQSYDELPYDELPKSEEIDAIMEQGVNYFSNK